MSKRFSRATFLKAFAGCAAAAVSGKLLYDAFRPASTFPLRMLGPSMELGHKMRDGWTGEEHSSDAKLVSTSANLNQRVTIIGGGIAGLSAGWWLKRNGFNDFQILELEKEVGGNSSFSRNAISAYPWGAHYVPLANPESEYVKLFFEELGVIQGTDANGLSIYNDLYMCHDPEERLFKNGTFQEGLIPRRGLQPTDKEEMDRFFAAMKMYREKVGYDRKPAFAIPVDLSSADEEFTSLDRISMAEWMAKNNFRGKPLLWYVDYCCRDDYGSSPANVSAWAGIHYFAGRKGRAANAEMNSVVTWPAGNGFLVEKLREKLGSSIKTGVAVTSVREIGNGLLQTVCFDRKANKIDLHNSQFVIFAAPRFLANHLVRFDGPGSPVSDLAYAPWMVANITVQRIPAGKGVDLAWDNVSFASKSLGYVVATHQNITTQRNAPTVITYYYPMAEYQPSEGRRQLLSLSAEEWSTKIVADLEKMHPGIRQQIRSMDLWPWGHGMIRPSVGFIWGDTRRKMKENVGNLLFAHSDMSGISNFEEAQYHGVEAAKSVLNKVART